MTRFAVSDGDVTLATDGVMGIGDAARYLDVSVQLLHKREKEGLIKPGRRGPRRDRYYTVEQLDEWSAQGLVSRRPPGTPSQRRLLAQRPPLSFGDEQECLRIAQAVATNLVRRFRRTEWEDAFSDALEGVAFALSRPADDDCPWNVSCYTHARWAALSGIERRTGQKTSDLAPWDQPPVSLEGALAETSAARTTALEHTGRVLDRMILEPYLNALDRVARVVVVNAIAHKFTDQEIADDLGVSRSTVGQIRRDTLRWLREVMREELAPRAIAA